MTEDRSQSHSNIASLNINSDGWLAGVRHCISPNFNKRPLGVDIDLLIVHNISLPPGQYGGHYIESFFCNQLDKNEHSYFAEIAALQVSAHCLIKRSGEIVQFVSFLDRAWHAGRSEFQGRIECNDYSVGIELEGCDHEAYEPKQYLALAAVAQALLKCYPKMNCERMTGHSDVAPKRKTDPGPAFDWAYFKSLIQAYGEHHASY